MERADLLEANGGIFKPQGEAINDHAADDVRVLVVGNPANTNALIAMSNAPDVPARALHRDDAPRPQPRDRAARATSRAPRGRHHQHDDLGQPLRHPVPRPLPREGGRRRRGRTRSTTRPGSRTTSSRRCGKRGAAIIEARGASSAASAANAAIDHVRDWVLGTADGDWVSMAVPSDGSYGVEEGLISSFPVHHARRRRTRSSQGLEVDDFSRARIDATVAELREERDAVTELGLV